MKPAAPDPALVAAIRDTCQAARTALAVLEQYLPEASRRAAIPTGRDGYPARASGAQPSSTGQATAHHVATTDEHDGSWAWCECGWITISTMQRSDAESWAQQHEDEHAPAISYSDPTGEACASNGRGAPDPTRRDARRARTLLDRSTRQLADAAALVNAITNQGRASDPDDDLWCTHHLRQGMGCTPARAGGLCDFCASVRADTGRLPHRKLLERKHNGTVTTKDL